MRSIFGTLMRRVPPFVTECTPRALPARTTVIAAPDEIGGVCAPPFTSGVSRSGMIGRAWAPRGPRTARPPGGQARRAHGRRRRRPGAPREPVERVEEYAQ